MISQASLKPKKAMLFVLFILAMRFQLCAQSAEQVAKTDWGPLKPIFLMNKWGFTDKKTGELVIPTSLDWIQIPQSLPVKYIIGVKKGKWGSFAVDGETIVPFHYDSIKDFSFSVHSGSGVKLFVLQNDKWSLAPHDLEKVSSLTGYDFIYSMNQAGYVKFKRGQNFGLIDLRSEKEIVPAAYDDFVIWPSYIKFKHGQKFGLIDLRSGKEIFPAAYDDLEILRSYYIKFKKDQKFGLISYSNKKEIIPPLYDSIDVRGRQIKAWIGKKVGVISLDDFKEIMPFKFEDVGLVTTQGALVKMNGKCGYSRPSGELLFPTLYDSIYYPWGAHDTNAFVRLNGKWGKVGMNGVEIIPILYDEIYGHTYLNSHVVRLDNKYGVYQFSKLVLPVKYDDFRDIVSEDKKRTKHYVASFPTKAKLDGKWGYIDSTGVERTPFKYDEVDLFVPFSSSPLIGGRDNGKWALINLSGTEVTPFKYDTVLFHSETLDHSSELWKGVFSARYNGKWGLMNQEGLEITPFKYMSIIEHNGIIFEASIDGKKMGLITDKGKELTSFKYDEFKFFKSYCPNTLRLSKTIAARIDRKWFLIDTDGNVFDPKAIYDGIMPLSDGLAPVLRESGWGFIDQQGKVVIPCQYEEADYFWNGQAFVKKNGKWGVINKKGETIMRFDIEEKLDPCDSESGNNE